MYAPCAYVGRVLQVRDKLVRLWLEEAKAAANDTAGSSAGAQVHSGVYEVCGHIVAHMSPVATP